MEGAGWQALDGDKPKKSGADVKVIGIPLENARLAIRMVRARQKRVLSETRKAELDLAGNSTRFGVKRPFCPAPITSAEDMALK
jgi:hypothetical protein